MLVTSHRIPSSLSRSSLIRAVDDGTLSCRLVEQAFKMSMLSAAALLDELMGVDRNRAPNEKKTALHWSDPQVVIMMCLPFYELFSWVFVRFPYLPSQDEKVLIECRRVLNIENCSIHLRFASTFFADSAHLSSLSIPDQIWVSIKRFCLRKSVIKLLYSFIIISNEIMTVKSPL